MLKIYASDERLIVYDNNRKIWDTFPAVVVENGEPVDFISSEKELNNNNREIVRPFRQGIIISYKEAEWLLRKAIKGCKKLRPLCRIAISPHLTETELRAMQYWYRKWYDKKLPQLVYEPIAFLSGMDLSDGIVLYQRDSWIITSVVQNKKIIDSTEYFGAEKNRHIDSIIEDFLNDCYSRGYSFPIYFTSYKGFTELTDNRFSKYHINRIDYEDFCTNIIEGLGSDNLPLCYI